MLKAQEIIEKELKEINERKDIYLYDMDKYGETNYNTSMLNELSACERMLKRILEEIRKGVKNDKIHSSNNSKN